MILLADKIEKSFGARVSTALRFKSMQGNAMRS